MSSDRARAHSLHPVTSLTVSCAWGGRLLALIGKEGRQILRDPSSWLVAFVLPCLFLLFFGYAVSLDADNLRLAVIDESGGAKAHGLGLSFAHSPHFRLVPAASRQEAARMMGDSIVQGVLVLPSHFDARLAAGRDAPAQLLVDGSEPNTANFINAYTRGVVAAWQAAEAAGEGMDARPPLSTEPAFWYNNAAKSRWALVPGSITIVMTLIGTLLTSLVITREWERGTMEALFASPVSRLQILLSKLVPYYLLAMLSMMLCTLAGVWLFGVPLRGSAGALALLTTAFLMPALGQGLLVSSLFRSQLPAAMTGFLSGLMPSLILSGLLFDIQSMPKAIQYITYLIPARYFNVSLQTLFLAGDVWPLFIESMAYMAGLGGLFFILTYRRLVKRLD